MERPIKLWMLFEVLAVTKEVAEQSLEQHITKLEQEKITILKKKFEETQEVEKPHPQIEKGYSRIAELEFEAKNFSSVIDLVLNYGPSMVEILEPKKIEMSLGDAQDSLNSVAGMMHRFLEAGLGGVVISGNT